MISAVHLPYSETNSFSKIVLDYINKSSLLQPFYALAADLEGLKKSIDEKRKQPVDRDLLVRVLTEQYKDLPADPLVAKNIGRLIHAETFTVCTAHQPNLFTGPLYVIYKIIHTIKLADHLNSACKDQHFVPVYYMGSEDADLAELDHFTVMGKEYRWQTNQKGAVGRMLVDKDIKRLITELKQQIGIYPFGADFIDMLTEAYQPGTTIQKAMLQIINRLFGHFGLVVLIADDARLKRNMVRIFEEDIFHQKPSEIVEGTCKRLGNYYNVQAHPRDINIFYLKDDIRERIIEERGLYKVNKTDISFTKEEMQAELESFPERFSPNVILRGLYQEMILPDIAFIGGGGELSYWLQLKDLFESYGIQFPVLVLRNSFLVVEDKWQRMVERLGISINDIFHKENELMNNVLNKHSVNNLKLNGELEKAALLFDQVSQQAGTVDPTLLQHAAALKANSLNALRELEKKMVRAEKRKFTDQQRQVQKLRSVFFPKNDLQERVENISSYYAKKGSLLLEEFYNFSLTLQQQFTILTDQIH